MSRVGKAPITIPDGLSVEISAWFPARNFVSKENKRFPGETDSNWNYQAEADSEIPITVNRNESRKISRMV